MVHEPRLPAPGACSIVLGDFLLKRKFKDTIKDFEAVTALQNMGPPVRLHRPHTHAAGPGR